MARSATPLKTTQNLLLRLITAPEGVQKALKDSPRTVLPVKGDRRLSAVERLDIYANMYFYRIRDALKEDFPVILKILGEIGFHNLITQYLIKYPSTHYSLRYAGQHLPRFLKRHPFLKKYPYLSDLAQMEWALLEAFDAPDSPVLTKKDLEGISPDRWNDLRFKLIPAFSILNFSWRVDQIRERALKGRARPAVKRSSFGLAVWRRDYKVFYRCVEGSENRILKNIQKGASFGDLCEGLSKKMGPQAAALTLARFLQIWLGEGWLAPTFIP